MTVELTGADFDQKVLQSAKPVLVDFFATWCGPCKMLAPVIEELAGEVAGQAEAYKVDVDQAPEIAQRYGIMSVPTIIVFQNGEVKNQTMGAQPKQALLEMLG